jgi:hypothetical protein
MGANRAYLRACLDAELTGADVSYTATATAETIAASSVAGTEVLRVQHIRLVSSQQFLPLQQVSRQELQDYRAVDESEGVPQFYSAAYVNGTPTLDFFPGLSVGDVVKMSYLAAPAALTSAATTATPTHMPEMFHHDIITNAAVAALKERDGNIDEASVWNARSLEAMVRLEEYLGQMGGTANRAYITPAISTGRYPDNRRR